MVINKVLVLSNDMVSLGINMKNNYIKNEINMKTIVVEIVLVAVLFGSLLCWIDLFRLFNFLCPISDISFLSKISGFLCFYFSPFFAVYVLSSKEQYLLIKTIKILFVLNVIAWVLHLAFIFIFCTFVLGL